MLEKTITIELLALLIIIGVSLFYTSADLFGFIKFVNPRKKPKKVTTGFLESVHKYKTEGPMKEFVEAFSKQEPNGKIQW